MRRAAVSATRIYLCFAFVSVKDASDVTLVAAAVATSCLCCLSMYKTGFTLDASRVTSQQQAMLGWVT